MSQQQETPPVERPWWREPMVWMVIGGPAAVVVASFVTLGLALKYPDPVLDDKAGQQVPALKARNHAATGGRQ